MHILKSYYSNISFLFFWTIQRLIDTPYFEISKYPLRNTLSNTSNNIIFENSLSCTINISNKYEQSFNVNDQVLPNYLLEYND